MGLLTELFVADENEAKAYGPESAGRFAGVQLGGLTNLEFESLWAILASEEWSPKAHSLSQVASSDNCWTFRFPHPYVERLIRLDGPLIQAAAKTWAATEEISGSTSDVEPVIESLAKLARLADESRRGLYLWVSL